MEICQYVKKMKIIYHNFIKYIGDDDDDENQFLHLSNIFDKLKIRTDAQSLESLFTMIVKVCDYHKRNPSFFTKIIKILELFKNDLKNNFTNLAIFKIFESNKRILLFLFEQGIIKMDDPIVSILTNSEYKSYFDPEITKFRLKKDVEKQEDFDLKRKEGENDNYICKLIREDNVEEFIVYMNQFNIPFDSNIIDSIFETNLLLLKRKNITLIEYATFFGSIRIFNYLKLEVELTPILWIYAVHSGNAEIIQCLEDNNIKPIKSYEKLYKISIKCHDKCLSEYFYNMYLNHEKTKEFGKSSTAYGIKYRNFHYIPKNLTKSKFNFCYSCKYNEKKIVELYINNNHFDLKTYVISMIIFPYDVSNQHILI